MRKIVLYSLFGLAAALFISVLVAACSTVDINGNRICVRDAIGRVECYDTHRNSSLD